MRLRHLFTLLPALLLGLPMAGQTGTPVPCLNNDPGLLEQLHGNDPEQLARMAQAEAELEAHTAEFVQHFQPGEREPYIISVVFHIIHMGGPENVLDEQLYDAIRILNEDFNKENPDWQNVQPAFLDLVADVGVEFRLARKDPQGNCTNGITRTQSLLTYQGDYEMVDLINWPRHRYMNVWVAASANGAAGYTNYPGALHNFPDQDGIVILHNYVGSIGTSSPGTSRVLTHEVGHWLNLRHAWGNSNNPGLPSNCNQDDQVADTPNTMGWTACLLSGSTCDETQDNVENYMEYSYCCKMFTNGQGVRMLAALNSGTAQRNQLWQPATLAQTGVLEEGVLCEVSYHSSRREICAGESVQYVDQSFNAVTARTWDFPGGEPATSTEQYPVVTYLVPGVYPMTLAVSDGTDTLVQHVEEYVTVLPSPGADAPFHEGFEVADLAGTPWTIVNPNNDNTWQLTGAAAYTGEKSVRILNTSGMAGRQDELVYSTVDMSAMDPLRLSFKYAYARRNVASDDRLRVYVSNNCGATWSMRKQLRGQVDLNTVGAPQGGSFVPGAGQWAECVITNISSAYQVENMRVKFEFESDGGNNLYLDDINLYSDSPLGTTGPQGAGAIGLTVVPSPAGEQGQAWLSMQRPGPLAIDLLDLTGRTVARVYSGVRPAGTHRIDLPLHGVAAGAYLLRATTAPGTEMVRFIKE
ncbi:MAG: M43 family zinc metalloprotease [Flavobacteriales bacterium]|jgi:PKD repeat protein|nr:M43 family zinc metalloprotease [Flavobacteriales bacterium]